MNKYRSRKAGKMIIQTYDLLLESWGVPYQEVFVDTRYGKTHVILCGDKKNPPLVLFHGVGDDSALMWMYNAKRLSEKFMLYAVDSIGGPGKSELCEKYNKKFDDVIWIDDIFDGLTIDKAYVAGVSHGGYLVQRYSVDRPQRVIHGISMAGAFSKYRESKKNGSLKTMMKIFLPEALFPTKKNTEKLIRKMSGMNYNVFTENELFMEHFRWLLKGFNNMAMGYHKVVGLKPHEVGIVKSKVNYLLGTEDPFQKMGGLAQTRDAGVELTVFDGAGHGINQEMADAINEEIIRIFSEYVQ